MVRLRPYLAEQRSHNANTSAVCGNVAGLGTYTQHQTIQLPPTFTGPEFLLIVANGANYQPETNYGNNTYAVPIDVSAADLTVTSVTGPPVANVGNIATVGWTVMNVGTGEASQQWTDLVYISHNNVLDGSAIPLEYVSESANSPLAAGGSYTSSVPVMLPGGLPAGTYYFLVKADYYGQQSDTNRFNQVAAFGAGRHQRPNWSWPRPARRPAASLARPSTSTDGAERRRVLPLGPGAMVFHLSTHSSFDGTATLIQTVSAANFSPLGNVNGSNSYNQSTAVTIR